MKSLYLALFFISVLLNVGVESGKTPIENALRRDFKKYFETGRTGNILKHVAKELDLKNLFMDTESQENWSEPKVNLFCTTCAAGMNELLRLNDSDLIINKAAELCIDLGFGSQYVCEGLVSTNEDEILYIVMNTPDESGNDICGVIFVSRGCTSRNPDRVWEVTLPDVSKPPIDETPFPQTEVPTMKILHLADTHYDPEYYPGGPIMCDDLYLCCRNTGTPSNSDDAAGFWGSYGSCDIPIWTLSAMYDHISKTHPDIDLIIWTGDLVPHIVWDTSREGNLAIINEMADLVVEYFPGVPVYPAVGNHESDPVNLFPQPYVTDPQYDISWLYDELASIWSRWLPEEAAASVARSAFYSVEVMPGLRILSVNTMYCYELNWWLIHDSTDIADELDIIAKELQKSEDIGEFVYIFGHIPPGNGDCLLTWSNQFNKVVARYENTISGIFYGHTHKDHFELFFDPEHTERVYEIGYIGQSQTTYSNLNPGYKVYTIEGHFEGSRYRVLDHENWILNLTLANSMNETVFEKLYSAKEEYGLPDLSPQSWYDLVLQMNEPNSELFDSFRRNYYKAGTPSQSSCIDSCKQNMLCGLLTSDFSDQSKCDMLNN